MATSAPLLPPRPPPNIPMVDISTGKLTVAWAEWLRAVEIILRQVRSEIP